jgi:hypothetical protein
MSLLLLFSGGGTRSAGPSKVIGTARGTSTGAGAFAAQRAALLSTGATGSAASAGQTASSAEGGESAARVEGGTEP